MRTWLVAASVLAPIVLAAAPTRAAAEVARATVGASSASAFVRLRLGTGIGAAAGQAAADVLCTGVTERLAAVRDEVDPGALPYMVWLDAAARESAGGAMDLHGQLILDFGGRGTAKYPLDCSNCGGNELVASVLQQLDADLALARAGRGWVSDPAAAATADPSATTPPPRVPDRDVPTRYRVHRPLAIAGVSLLGVGAASLTGGGALLGVGTHEVLLRRTGIALTAVGAAALVAGVTMLALDVRRFRRGTATVALAPVAAPSFAGLTTVVRW